MDRVLQVAEDQGIVLLSVPEAVQPGLGAERLALRLLEIARDAATRGEPHRAVVLRGGLKTFWLEPPNNARDLDAVAPFWPFATAAVGELAPPTVAVIEDAAIGPAWELALACDLRICAEDARVGSPEVRWGRMSSAGGTQRLARLVGPGRALWLLLRGEILSGAEALSLGLVQRAVPRSELSACVDDVLRCLRASAPIALAYAKEAAHSGLDLPLTDGMRLEADLASLLQTTADRAEGIAALRERRRPRFEGR